MIHVQDTGFPPGTIVVPSGAQPRFYEFTFSMERLKVPAGTRWLQERGCDITTNLNLGVRDATGDWVWFMGDDHKFNDDMLLKLLAWDKDVVIPPTPCKSIPFLPCIMHGTGSLSDWKPSMPLYTWEEVSQPGLLALPVGDFIGQAGMLVKKKVLDEFGYPWFKAGQQDPGRLQEDMTFCRELQQRGYTIWLDCTQVLDHWFSIGLTARKHEGQWVPALDNNGHIAVLPDMVGERFEDGSTGFKRHTIPLKGGSDREAPPSRVPAWLDANMFIDYDGHSSVR
jgi:hypothetical protein